MVKVLTKTGLVIVTLLLAVTVRAELLIPAPPDLPATGWIMMDAATGQVLAEHNADERLPPASLTKLMTSYIIAKELSEGKASLDDMVPVSVKAWRTGGSRMYIQEGTEVRLEDLQRGMIIQSGNDASVAIAEYVAGSESGFADVMNQQARLLGMENSHFVNATGWPAEGHYSSARDMALLMRAMIANFPEQYALYSEREFEYGGIRQQNRNTLLRTDSTVDGGKTGWTDEAGYCLVASAQRDDMRLITVVMGTASATARANASRTLLSYGFRYYETARILSAGEVLSEGNRVWYGQQRYLDLAAPEDVTTTIPRGSRDELTTEVDIEPTLKAPIEKGQQLGVARVFYQDKLLQEIPVVAAEAVPQSGLFSRLWDAITLFFINLFS